MHVLVLYALPSIYLPLGQRISHMSNMQTNASETQSQQGRVLCLQAHAGKGGSRAVYIAPKPELAKERFADWTQKFGTPGLGLNVCLLTGDPLADYAMLREANIVISTPEHWDMLSRRWRQQSRKEVRNVALFLVDELHLIGGANGPVLEVGSPLHPPAFIVQQAANHGRLLTMFL